MLELLLEYDPVAISILLSIDNIDALYKLYCTNVNKYDKFLNDKWILNQLATNFNFKGKYNTFNDFKRMYRMKILEAPSYSVFDKPYGTTGLLEAHIDKWPYKRAWIEKLEIIQYSKKVNKIKILHSYNLYYYRSKDNKIQWTYKTLLILNNTSYKYIPNKLLFDFIIDLYEQEFEQTKVVFY